MYYRIDMGIMTLLLFDDWPHRSRINSYDSADWISLCPSIVDCWACRVIWYAPP